jgi:hypothetical protein
VDTGYATFITPIDPGEEEELRRYLCSEIEPRYDPATILECKEAFRFDEIHSVHFCSFIILEGDRDEGLPPYLVFEATFDGPRDFFLDALLHHARNAIHEIYKHCKDYPASGLTAPNLIKNYLAVHDVGAHLFFRGSPARTVEQVKGEASVRHTLVTHLSDRWRSRKMLLATFADLQQELQHVVRKNPAMRWAEQLAAVPWEVTSRKAVLWLAGAGLLAACGLGAFLLLLLCPGLSRVVMHWPEHIPALGGFTGLLAAWIIARGFELFLEYEDPREKTRMGAHFRLAYILQGLRISQYAFIVAFAGFAALLLDPNSKLAPAFTNWLLAFHPSTLGALFLLLGAAIVFLILRHFATSLRLAVQFKELEPNDEKIRRFSIDCLRVAMGTVAIFALFVGSVYVNRIIPSQISSLVVDSMFPALRIVLAAVAYILAGVIIVYFIVGVLFLLIRIMERRDRTRFANAEELTTIDTIDNSHVYAREEGGTNTYQNFLASLTYVKPGRFSIWSLRLTLFIINLLARFWYNVGDLGDIPTILSARWVIIDNDKRLLFLDHYGGAWDSYLNEFIDMGAVKGVNAIWTNTFVKARGKKYGFPETEYRFWKGAQIEKPFKAYVRQSQIETIVWYSAYPRLATVNINEFTDIRQRLFKPFDACEVDSLLQKL